MRKIVRLHEGLRALYPDAVVFGGIGRGAVAEELDRVRALLGMTAASGDRSALSIAVGSGGLAVWAQSPVVTLHRSQLGAIGVDEGVMDVTAVVAGKAASFRVPLAAPAESARIADRLLAALA